MSNGFRYAKIYDRSVGALSVLTKKELLLFIHLATLVKVESNALALTKQDKDNAAFKVGVTGASINNFLSKFCKCNLMLNNGGGYFLMNPSIANRAQFKSVPELSCLYVKEKMSRARSCI
jgi:hypothetical protein